MASADFRFDIRTPREARSQWHQIGSPQVRRTSFLPVHRIYVSDSCMSIGYWVVVPPHPSEPPHIRFLFVEHAFCYRLPPDLVLPPRPCRVANPSPHRAGSGFSPYRSAPCWAQSSRGSFHLPLSHHWACGSRTQRFQLTYAGRLLASRIAFPRSYHPSFRRIFRLRAI